MSDFFLEAQRRTEQGKAVRKLRHRDLIPAVLYGHGVETTPIQLKRAALERVWRAAGESTLVDVQLDAAAPVKVIIQDVQYEPASNAILHVDLHQVNMKEKVRVDVALVFTGDSAAVKELGGTLVRVRDRVEVEALPGDLVKEIAVDVARLATFEDEIAIKDLAVPAGLTILDNPEDVIAHVEAPRSEEELAALEGAVEEDVSSVEVTGEKEKAEAEAEEGAAEGAAAPAEAAQKE